MSSRDRFRRIAEENLLIFEAGGYSAIDGRWVDLSAALGASRDGTCQIEPPARLPDAPSKAPVVEFLASDTIAAAEHLRADGARRLALLNFASARTPGGGFLRGATAQEESLCRATTLYDALRRQEAFYARNKAWPDTVYADAGLSSPGVMVFRDQWLNLRPDPFAVHVLTVPAPNLNALKAPPPTLGDRISQRIAMMLLEARKVQADTLILGAWGCGVFGNDPQDMAARFDEALRRVPGPPSVLVAVPGQPGDPVFDAFAGRFSAAA